MDKNESFIVKDTFYSNGGEIPCGAILSIKEFPTKESCIVIVKPFIINNERLIKEIELKISDLDKFTTK